MCMKRPDCSENAASVQKTPNYVRTSGKDVKSTVFHYGPRLKMRKPRRVGNHMLLIIITRWPSSLKYIHGIYAAF